MQTITLQHAAGLTPIRCGAALLREQTLWQQLISARGLIVTDETVADLYLPGLLQALNGSAVDYLVLPDGEQHKTLSTWQRILDHLAETGAQRDTTLIALGGGVIGDMTGFAAASYMRGINVIQVPTTLLAQVDAAVGGKTGVNLNQGKNLVGAFHQPSSVIIDVECLDTLEQREYSAGLAEVVKYGLIRDCAFLDWLEQNKEQIMRREPESLVSMISRSVQHKVEVVEADEREQGQRALLNLGHTFGHAIETATAYQQYRHGEAVAIGMQLAANLSAELGWIDSDDADRLRRLLTAFKLPLNIPESLRAEQLLDLMQLDKKNQAGRLRLVLLKALGQAIVTDDVPSEQVLAVMQHSLQSR